MRHARARLSSPVPEPPWRARGTFTLAGSPVILLVMAMNTPDMQYLGRICQDLGVRAGVPVSVILDHGATYEEAIRAIQARACPGAGSCT